MKRSKGFFATRSRGSTHRHASQRYILQDTEQAAHLFMNQRHADRGCELDGDAKVRATLLVLDCLGKLDAQ